ncbi:hypothetical protein GJ496_002680 [Pomphorhynchus laevis]|nr:hypothetical protein GJ496_002680 [Pomphorhynchus laevis]
MILPTVVWTSVVPVLSRDCVSNVSFTCGFCASRYLSNKLTVSAKQFMFMVCQLKLTIMICVYMAKNKLDYEYRTQPCGESFYIDGAVVYSHITIDQNYDDLIGDKGFFCIQSFKSDNGLCGVFVGANNTFNHFISPTGIVTVLFSTDKCLFKNNHLNIYSKHTSLIKHK